MPSPCLPVARCRHVLDISKFVPYRICAAFRRAGPNLMHYAYRLLRGLPLAARASPVRRDARDLASPPSHAPTAPRPPHHFALPCLHRPTPHHTLPKGERGGGRGEGRGGSASAASAKSTRRAARAGFATRVGFRGGGLRRPGGPTQRERDRHTCPSQW